MPWAAYRAGFRTQAAHRAAQRSDTPPESAAPAGLWPLRPVRRATSPPMRDRSVGYGFDRINTRQTFVGRHASLRREFVRAPLGDGLSGLCGASVAMSDRSKSRRPRAKAGLGMNPVFKCGAIGVCATVVLVACEYTVAVHLLYPLLCIPSKCTRG